MTEAEENNSVYPWVKIIEFHKEIVRRGQTDFYALQLNADSDSNRWSYIVDFDINNFEGPWVISKQDIKSSVFARRIVSGEVSELYLGGPFWIQDRITAYGRKYKPHLHPFFVREVSLLIDPDEDLQINPVEMGWEVSPLVLNLLDHRQISLSEDIDVIGERIMNQVTEELESMAIQPSRRIKELIIENIPEMELYFNSNNYDMDANAHWLLFSPPGTSPITKYSMNDYESMLNHVQSTGNFGGLTLLEKPDWSKKEVEDEKEVIPIVPLNPSQKEAVEGILKSRPITVISGPPGCGKSQVVLSLILNAWMRGVKVLFASNNNQAVDVVKERLQDFEKDITIAVRAGSASTNKVLESIQGIIKYLSVNDHGVFLSEEKYQKRSKAIMKEKNNLESFLDSQLPAQIEQGFNAAVSAYASYLETRKQKRDKIEFFKERIKAFGYDTGPEEFYIDVFTQLDKWFKSSQAFINRYETIEKERKEIESKVDSLINKRKGTIEEIGANADYISNWNWLSNQNLPKTLESWLHDFQRLFESGIEKDLADFKWDESYNRWNGSDECREWIKQADICIENINKNSKELKPKLEKIDKTRNELETRFSIIEKYGFKESWKAPANILNDWLKAYISEITREHGTFDFLPFSEAARIHRELKKKEAVLKQIFSLSVWKEIGKINDESRKKLSIIVENTSKYLETLQKWDSLIELRTSVQTKFNSLRETASSLNIEGIPDNDSLADWNNFSKFLKSKIEFAYEAEEKWGKRERKNTAVAKLKEMWSRIEVFKEYPFWDLWINSKGKKFYESFKLLMDNPSTEKAKFLKGELSKAELNLLIDLWRKVSMDTLDIEEYQVKLKELKPYESLVDLWVNEAPDNIFIPEELKKDLPIPDTEAKQTIDEIYKWESEWSDYSEKEAPQVESKLAKEYEWAKENIYKTIALIPDDEIRNNLENELNNYVEESNNEWPVEDIRNAFARFNTRIIKGKMQKLNRSLQRLSFQYAKQKWHDRLIEDDEVLTALNKLSIHYSKNRNAISAEKAQYFDKALKALPVWVTTAQSPQSIPVIPELFDVVVIDEATQCTLTNLLPLIYRAKRLAVIGDPEQLPAIPVISTGAENLLGAKIGVKPYLEILGHAENNVYKTAVQSLPRHYSDVIQLREHYRSHPLIIGFSNYYIYKQDLHLRKEPGTYIPEITGVSRINVDGKASRGKDNSSWLNRREAEMVAENVSYMNDNGKIERSSLGIVTPFRAQKELIQQLLDEKRLSRRVTVGTAHTYQGDERDIMIFSPVVSEGMQESTVRWVEEPRNLINVAVTRAREGLIVVANFAYLRKQKGLLGKLAEFIDGVEILKGSSFEELELYAWMLLQGMNPKIHPAIGDSVPSFLIENDGISLCLLVSEEEDKGKETRLMGQGYGVLHVNPRAIRETPAIVLKEIASNLAMNEFEPDEESFLYEIMSRG